MGQGSLFATSESHFQEDHHAHILQNHFKIFFGTKGSIGLGFSTQHWGPINILYEITHEKTIKWHVRPGRLRVDWVAQSDQSSLFA